MFVGVVLQKQSGAKTVEQISWSTLADTPEEAGSAADDYATQLRKQNAGWRYRVAVGELTHEVTPPERKIVLTPIKN